MTVNDVNKVDASLKSRPIRLKFFREFGNPELETRKTLLPLQWAEESEGLNLDQIFRLKEFHAQGLSIYDAKKNLGKEDRAAEIERLAYELYQKRTAEGLVGDSAGDWIAAEQKLGLTTI